MNTTLTTIKNHRNVLLAGAGVAIALGLSACGGSTAEQNADAGSVTAPVIEPAGEIVETTGETATDSPGSADSTGSAAIEPATVAEAAPSEPVIGSSTNQPATESAPNQPADHELVVEQPTVAEAMEAGQVIPASGFELPCESYDEATELPLFPCSKGELVKDFQRVVHYADDTFEIDGYFGPSTYEAVVGYQLSFQMLDTGVIDDLLMEMMDTSMNHAEPIDDPADDWHGEWADDIDGEQYDDAVHGLTEYEHCLELEADIFSDVELSDEQIWVCEDLGIRLTSGD